MLCDRQGCPNIIKGPICWAQVFDENLAKTGNPDFSKPWMQAWCPECYKVFEAHKYCYVIQTPDQRGGERVKRVPRIGQEGEPLPDAPISIDAKAPVDPNLPPWASQAAGKQVDFAGIPIKKPGRPKKAQESDAA